MTTAGMHGDGAARLRYFAPAVVVSLLLSPITAVWAVALGAAVALVAAVVLRLTGGHTAWVVLHVALGVLAGALPYILAGLAISAFDSGAPSSGAAGG